MKKSFLGLALVLTAISAAAQVSGSGTSRSVPQFTGTSSIGNSPISISGSNVGIGTTAPNGALHVAGTGSNVVVLGESGNNGRQISLGITPDGNGVGTIQAVYQLHAFIPLLLNPNGGNVGVGTTAPAGLLDINNPTASGGVIFAATNIDPNGYTMPNLANTGKMLIGWNRSGGGGEFDFIANRAAGGSGGYGFWDYTNAGVVNNLMMLRTSNTGATLEVNGSVKLATGTGASMTYPDNTVQSTAWTGVLTGGDYAESVNVSGVRSEYEPGDVLVIDPNSEGNFLKSSAPYSTTVTGIYSTKPGVVGRRQHTAQEHMKEEVPMAMTGIVPTKVSAENGPIKAGDLLVTSSKSGYAMKGTDRSQMLGAVIGKAIGHLDAGTGVIEAVVTLQ